MTDIGSLVTTLRLDSAKFATDLKKSSNNVNSFAAKTNRSLAKAQKSWKGFSDRIKSTGKVALGVVATGGGLYILAKKSLEYSDTIAKTADKIGITTDALQEYRYAAEHAGVKQKVLDMGLQRFYRRVAEAAKGAGELKETLKLYGIELRDVNGTLRDSQLILGDYANAMQGAESQQEQLRMAFKGFDSEGAALVNMLRDGSSGLDQMRERARRLGIVLDESLLRNSEKTIDSITDLEYILKANLTRTMVTLGPHIGQIATNMADWVVVNDDFIKQRLPEKVDDIAESLKDIVGIYNSIPEGVVSGAGYGIAGGILFGKKAGVIVGVLVTLNTQLEKFGLNVGGIIDDYKELDKSLTNIWDVVSGKRDASTGNLKDLSGVRFPMPNQPPKTSAISATLPSATPSAPIFDKDKYQKILDDLKEKQSDYQFDTNQLDRDSWEQRRQEVFRWAATVEASMKKSKMWTEEMKNQVAASGAANLELIRKEKFISDIEEMTNKAEMFADTFKDSFVDLVTQGEINFKSLGTSFAAMIADMIIESEKMKFLEGFKSSASGGGGWVSSITGGIMNMFDSGGWVTEPVVGVGTRSGESYSFAEHGPEFVSKRGGGGGSSAPIINIENHTGSNISSDQESNFDGHQWVTSIVLEAAGNNRNGFKNSLNMALGR